MLHEISAWIAAQKKPKNHRLRWLVSLNSVKMKIEKRLGDFEAALRTAETCAAINPVPFSPLLAARTVEALFTAAQIRLVRRQTSEAVALLDQAIPLVRNALSGDWLNIVGDPAHPLPFGLPEVGSLALIAARCVALRAYLHHFAQRPGMVWTQALALSHDHAPADGARESALSLPSSESVRHFAGEFFRLTQELHHATTAELTEVRALLKESRSELSSARTEIAAFLARIEVFRQREGRFATKMAVMRAELSARDLQGQATSAELAQTQVLLEECRANLLTTKAELSAFPPLVEALQARERSDRARIATMRAEASARRREIEAMREELSLSSANEMSARKALKAAQHDAQLVRQRLAETFERLADAERRASIAGP
jgi:hypothetical protein